MVTEIWINIPQVMACCLTAPSHYLHQCWLIISEVQWHSYQGNYTRDAQPSITKIHLKITYLKFHSNLPGAKELKFDIIICGFFRFYQHQIYLHCSDSITQNGRRDLEISQSTYCAYSVGCKTNYFSCYGKKRKYHSNVAVTQCLGKVNRAATDEYWSDIPSLHSLTLV